MASNKEQYEEIEIVCTKCKGTGQIECPKDCIRCKGTGIDTFYIEKKQKQKKHPEIANRQTKPLQIPNKK